MTTRPSAITSADATPPMVPLEGENASTRSARAADASAARAHSSSIGTCAPRRLP